MSVRLGPFALVLLASGATATALACGSNEPTVEAPSSAGSAAPPKRTDRTEVTMQTVEIQEAGAPVAPSGSNAPVPTRATAPGDASDDPMIGGPQEAVVEKSVAPIRPRLRACYKKALADQPGMAGTSTFDATIAKDGRVSSARFVKRDGLSDDMVGCLLTAVKTMTFAPDRKTQVVVFSFGTPSPSATGAGSSSPSTSIAAPAASFASADAGKPRP